MIDLLETLSLSCTVRLCKGVGTARSLSLRLSPSQQTFLCPLLMSAVDAQRFRYSVVSSHFSRLGRSGVGTPSSPGNPGILASAVEYSSFPSTPVFCKIEVQHHRSVENKQPNGSDLYKQNGRTHSQALCNLDMSLCNWSL